MLKQMRRARRRGRGQRKRSPKKKTLGDRERFSPRVRLFLLAPVASAALTRFLHPCVWGADPVTAGRRKQPCVVSAEELAGVSDLVKKRVKLSEVNQVYEAIFSHFQKRKA